METSPGLDAYANLDRAIAICEDTLSGLNKHKIQKLAELIPSLKNTLCDFSEQRFPVEWSKAHHYLGRIYESLAIIHNRTQNLNTAIAHYDSALRVRNMRDCPADFGATLNNKGNAYKELSTADQSKNLSAAINCYRAALQVFSRTRYPKQWAGTQSNLGNAYKNLSTGNRPTQLARAIQCYEAALRVYSLTEYPDQWAGVQNNIGSANLELATGDRSEHVKKAIECYHGALSVYSRDRFPFEWAITKNNLGKAYSILPTGDKRRNLALAMHCYRQSLEIYSRKAYPLRWATTLSNLGAAFAGGPTGDTTKDIKQAIRCYRRVLTVHKREESPEQWAGTLNNLGNAYKNLPPNGSAKNLELAIACYAKALEIRTEKDFPTEWATIQNNLGNAYRALQAIDHSVNINVAVGHYRAALRVRTRKNLPADRIETLRNLAGLFFESKDWREALTTCQEAITLLNSLRSGATVASHRKELAIRNAAFYDWAATCSIKMARHVDALLYTERGKDRHIIETMHKRDISPKHVSSATWSNYQRCLNQAEQIEQELESETLHTPESVQRRRRLNRKLSLARQELEQFERSFQAIDPDYLPTARATGFTDFRSVAIQTRAVLVEFCVTSTGTYVFLIDGRAHSVAERQVVRVREFTTEVLSALLNGWVQSYYINRDTWQKSMGETLGGLYELLLKDVHERIRTLYPEANRLILIPNKGLNILPLHAARDIANGQHRCLLDDYEISFAPSCAVLLRCLKWEEKRTARSKLFAVQNPNANDPARRLKYSDWEVDEVANHFPNKDILRGANATLASTHERIASGNEILFSCHGSFNLNNRLDSHLLLADGEKLTLRDILKLDMSNAWLIILSACETAMSDFQDQIDEVLGLHTAFLIARAPTVVGSLWTVYDLSTALLMQRFHKNLYESQMKKAAALRDAQLWLRDLSKDEAKNLILSKQPGLRNKRLSKSDFVELYGGIQKLADQYNGNPFSHPYFWAAFQCMGAG